MFRKDNEPFLERLALPGSHCGAFRRLCLLLILLALMPFCSVAHRMSLGHSSSLVIPIGQKLDHFCKELERANISTCGHLEKALSTPRFERFALALKEAVGTLHMEGLFVPGSYALRLQVLPQPDSCPTDCLLDAESVFNENANRLLEALVPPVEQRLRSARVAQGLSPYQQWTLASIVEKEAVSNTDYDLVAAVFQRRLQKNMPLGSCPAVEYALGFHRPFLLFSDLKIRSPYNLYVNRGLPPTPIAFFSDEALQAVQQPAAVEYLFFVFDWTLRKLLFASKFVDHERNAERARKNYISQFGRRNLYRAYPDRFYE